MCLAMTSCWGADVGVTRAQIVAEARSWLGTRWQHQGRVKGHGVDCAGLVIGVAHALGLSDAKVTGYGRRPDGFTLRALCDAHMPAVPLEAMRPGDVVLMRIVRDEQHLGILGEHGGVLTLIHAHAEKRKTVEHRLDELWRGRITAAYAFPGVSDE